MILDELRRAAETKIRAWSEDAGLAEPPPLVLTPAPPHVEADLSVPWPLGSVGSSRGA